MIAAPNGAALRFLIRTEHIRRERPRAISLPFANLYEFPLIIDLLAILRLKRHCVATTYIRNVTASIDLIILNRKVRDLGKRIEEFLYL